MHSFVYGVEIWRSDWWWVGCGWRESWRSSKHIGERSRLWWR